MSDFFHLLAEFEETSEKMDDYLEMSRREELGEERQQECVWLYERLADKADFIKTNLGNTLRYYTTENLREMMQEYPRYNFDEQSLRVNDFLRKEYLAYKEVNK